MSAIGRSHHLRCTAEGCNKRRPYWSQFCKSHRVPAPPKIESAALRSQAEVKS